MKRMAIVTAVGALLLGGCDVSVSSNDAATRDAINGVEEGAADLLNSAEGIASDTGEDLANAARDTGRELGNLGDRIDAQDGHKAE